MGSNLPKILRDVRKITKLDSSTISSHWFCCVQKKEKRKKKRKEKDGNIARLDKLKITSNAMDWINWKSYWITRTFWTCLDQQNVKTRADRGEGGRGEFP